MSKLAKQVQNLPELSFPKFTPFRATALKGNLFDVIRDHDVLLQHPYESFATVVDFIHQAAIDPQVLAVKMTLYRVSSKSPIISSLKLAAQNGKQVTVLVELKARFDEENNVHWAQELERAGCHVIYGLVGLKTHSKLALVVRREESGIRRYMHMATGTITMSLPTSIRIWACLPPMPKWALMPATFSICCQVFQSRPTSTSW